MCDVCASDRCTYALAGALMIVLVSTSGVSCLQQPPVFLSSECTAGVWPFCGGFFTFASASALLLLLGICGVAGKATACDCGVAGSIPTGGALEVWPWTFGFRTAWLINESAGRPPFIYCWWAWRRYSWWQLFVRPAHKCQSPWMYSSNVQVLTSKSLSLALPREREHNP